MPAAALAELGRRRVGARTAEERHRARQAVYEEASAAISASAAPFEARYRAANTLRNEMMGSEEADRDYLESTAEQQQEGREPRPTEGDLAATRTLPPGLQAVVDETERRSQRMDEAARPRAVEYVPEENLAGYEAMMAAARRGRRAEGEPRDPAVERCTLEVAHEE